MPKTAKQFGKSLIEFPRVGQQLAMIGGGNHGRAPVDLFQRRRIKRRERRCDLEAGKGGGMAKLLGARVAWAAADNGLQIHGGNGFRAGIPRSAASGATRAILNIF